MDCAELSACASCRKMSEIRRFQDWDFLFEPIPVFCSDAPLRLKLRRDIEGWALSTALDLEHSPQQLSAVKLAGSGKQAHLVAEIIPHAELLLILFIFINTFLNNSVAWRSIFMDFETKWSLNKCFWSCHVCPPLLKNFVKNHKCKMVELCKIQF